MSIVLCLASFTYELPVSSVLRRRTRGLVSFLIGQLGNHYKDAKVRVIIRSLVYLRFKVTYQGDLGRVSSCCRAVSTLTLPLPTEREHLGVS